MEKHRHLPMQLPTEIMRSNDDADVDFADVAPLVLVVFFLENPRHRRCEK
jgi:hypothetical protein